MVLPSAEMLSNSKPLANIVYKWIIFQELGMKTHKEFEKKINKKSLTCIYIVMEFKFEIFDYYSWKLNFMSRIPILKKKYEAL